ncbi:MAG: hypothetical protein LBI37_02070 [Puniceicoccales bacterium]|nr:hypothetical protein [Puniceicoccales bacterium]
MTESAGLGCFVTTLATPIDPTSDNLNGPLRPREFESPQSNTAVLWILLGQIKPITEKKKMSITSITFATEKLIPVMTSSENILRIGARDNNH